MAALHTPCRLVMSKDPKRWADEHPLRGIERQASSGWDGPIDQEVSGVPTLLAATFALPPDDSEAPDLDELVPLIRASTELPPPG